MKNKERYAREIIEVACSGGSIAVTNEQILEHLKEIEIAQGCIANGINTLFSVMIKRKEQLKLSKSEDEMIGYGEIALACITDRMADISGMNEKLNRYEK